MSNPCKLNLALSYVFQIRKQEGKSFFCTIQAHFFLRIYFKKIVLSSREKGWGETSREEIFERKTRRTIYKKGT
jgi:hypothetical protein